MKLQKRGTTFHLVRRVPRRFSRVEARDVMSISLKTDSESVAQEKAPVVWAQLLEAWEARLAGDTTDAEQQLAAAQNIAQARGFRYLQMPEVTALTPADLLDRVDAIPMVRGKPLRGEAVGLLGNAPVPEITVSRALELYWSLTRDQTLGKDGDQVRRWRNPRIKAIKNFVSVVGDVPISRISRDDLLDFQDMWMERIEREGLTPNSANKDLSHLSVVLKTVNEKKRLQLDLPLGGLKLKEARRTPRPSFSDDWIRDRILAPGALDGLNLEARCLLLGMINSGYRPSEAANLSADQIRLDGPIPYIAIAPTVRQLKNHASERDIPLVGVSLEAFRSCPDGFPRYRGKASLSNTVNKFLRDNGLLETQDHVMYSLRHSFEDRMIAANIDGRIRRDLFGHALVEQRYGQGASLEQKHTVLQSIALD